MTDTDGGREAPAGMLPQQQAGWVSHVSPHLHFPGG
jgi:hypothetical protein